MSKNIKPKLDYLLCEEVKDATGVVTTSDIADHWQKYKVLAVGEGHYNDFLNIWVDIDIKVGEVIYVQKHAEADSPDDLKANGLYLIQSSRVMATEDV